MSISIRNIVPADFPDLIRLFHEFSVFQKEPAKMTNSVEKLTADQELVMGFVAVSEEGEVLAYVTYFFTYHTWSGKSLYMDDLYVQQEFRGKGIGKALLEKVIEFAKDNNCISLRWLVSHWNQKAKQFYASIGAEISNNEEQCVLHLNND